jgi:hypothetical protein
MSARGVASSKGLRCVSRDPCLVFLRVRKETQISQFALMTRSRWRRNTVAFDRSAPCGRPMSARSEDLEEFQMAQRPLMSAPEAGELLVATTSPSRCTYRRCKGLSRWEVSFPTVAGKLDIFSATYTYPSILLIEPDAKKVYQAQIPMSVQIGTNASLFLFAQMLHSRCVSLLKNIG